ncbi:MAG: hypothetical protein LBU83_07030 [Bacteroidales bacterium]|nr:hypothetical protein [Bacteroidales bacterium]
MKKAAFILVLGITIVSIVSHKLAAQNGFVPADSLIVNIDSYVNTMVETEGFIAHVCGVDGKKMKLMSDNGEVIVIIPNDTTGFDYSLNKKRIKLFGLVKEERLSEQYIDEQEEAKSLLCHVDRRPCKDEKWINAKVEAGVADSMSKKDIEALRQKKEQQGKGYVSIVLIVCEKYEVIESNK